MNQQDNHNNIIELYLEQELLLASLYQHFSERYAAYKAFWASMSSEELEHASWVKHFLDGAVQNKIHFSEGMTRTNSLISSIAYIKGIISGFENEPFPLTKAASLALDIERSLLEKNVFKCFGGDSSEVKRILEILIAGQDDHIKKIEKFVSSIREKAKTFQH